MQLIDNWRTDWWRHWSTRVHAAAAALSGVLVAVPDAANAVLGQMPAEQRAAIGGTVALVLLGAGVLARLLKQDHGNDQPGN